MAPRVVLGAGHAIQVARRARLRQSRRTGATCKGRSTVYNRVEESDLILHGTKEVDTIIEEAQVALQTYLCSTYPETCTVESEKVIIEDVVVSTEDVSQANAAVEASLSNENDGLGLSEIQVESTIVLQDASEQEDEADTTLGEDVLSPRDHSLYRKTVHFDFEAASMHEVIPYAEIYGAHPRTFVFDKFSFMIPAARGGFVSANATVDYRDELEDSYCALDDDGDGGWESWLQSTDDEDDSVAYPQECEKRPLVGLALGTCFPDLDDETGWESWLESTLGTTEERFFVNAV